MSGKTLLSSKSVMALQVNPLDSPFREFRDNELQAEAWGLSTAAFKTLYAQNVKASMKNESRSGAITQATKVAAATLWVDDQTQPLPRSVRQYLNGWIRAQNLAMDRWGAALTIFDEINPGKMSTSDMQLCHAQVLLRSSFCRKVLSACFILERVEFIVEHQWELFTCVFAPEGWRAKYHIYSPGLKAGGGMQHKPTLSKNGCYLVRLYYLGAWRCVWVNDQVPVDTSGAPLLPFSPLLTHPPVKPGTNKVPQAVTAGVIHLWPLLLTKALLKLAAPDMNSDEDTEAVEDELIPDFSILHALTGSMNIQYLIPERSEDLWARIVSEVQLFSWDDIDDSSTNKSKSVKKPTAKELAALAKQSRKQAASNKQGASNKQAASNKQLRPGAMTYAILNDTKDYPSYHLPGLTPGHEMILLIKMARDVPIKKPLVEPELALWKYYRWLDWARGHGLYAAYECPRDKFIKVDALLKSSYAPHLLDVPSTKSITMHFIKGQAKSTMKEKDDDGPKKKKKEGVKLQAPPALSLTQQTKAELREWIQYDVMFSLLQCLHVAYHPSQFNMVAAGNFPPIRPTNTKSAAVKITDMVAPSYGPLYLQLDSPEKNILRISLATLHPRILLNSSSPIEEFIEPGHLVLEKFEWFKDKEISVTNAFLSTRRYDAVEISFDPGRHFFRIWTHYRVNWHLVIISQSTLLLSTRDVILAAAVRECPWAAKFLTNLGKAFSNWIKISRNGPTPIVTDREFFRSYLPDLTWDTAVVGYDRHFLHWMFRQALQSLLSRTMTQAEWKAAAHILRKYFCDPDFGFSPKLQPPRSLREFANLEICDCLMPENEETELTEEQVPEVPGDQNQEPGEQTHEEKPTVAPEIMAQLLKAPEPPVVSQVCELATSEIHCAILKQEMEKMIKKHEAATVLQAHWRGNWVRKVLAAKIAFTPDVTKCVMERAFGTNEALSNLMNEFFLMWPGTIYSYSVASALSGVYGLQQHKGITSVTSKCKWIPHFQGVFFCHADVKVHFDVQSSVSHSTVKVYNNDTEKDLPQVYNSHITFDFAPNFLGYTVLGYGTVAQVASIGYDAPWQLTVMSSLNNAFHICDNEDPCNEMPLPSSTKLHIDEIFLPNRRNILGGIQISVTKYETVSFRAAASSSDLEMVATLRSTLPNGATEELGTCSGRGELYWPFIRLEPTSLAKRSQLSYSTKELGSTRSLIKTTPRAQKATSQAKARSFSKVKINVSETKVFTIEVTCPQGWPLTLEQWTRVDEVRNSTVEMAQVIQRLPKKGSVKEKEKSGKTVTAKEKEKEKPLLITVPQPIPGDAYVELECALAVDGGAVAKRDDKRDLEFTAARQLWAASEPNRNQRGDQIRKEFRAEFLEVPPPPPGSSPTVTASVRSGSTNFHEGLFEDAGGEDAHPHGMQRPTPVSGTDLGEMTVEAEEETLYLQMPDSLRDKFIPLYFLPFCTKEKTDEPSVLLTPDMAEAAKQDRHARIEASLERMRELQLFNEEEVIGRQRNRTRLLEKLFVDATMKPEIVEVMEQKQEAIEQEVNLKNVPTTKKKMEPKK